MPQELLEPEQFLERLTKAFAEGSSSGTVWLSHKRFTREDGDVAMADGAEETEFPVLIRATHAQSDSKNVKFSTRIPPARLVEFHTKYGALLKASYAPQMRKRDKKKEKARAEAAAAKRREVYRDIETGTAGKRGKGHRQRQRKVKAQEKKERERERIEAKESQEQEH